jgi:hypothetical protein
MLVVVTFVFVLTTTPITIYFVGKGANMWPADTDDLTGFSCTYLAYSVCNMLFYLNSAVNFFLYCVSGSHFRHALQVCARSVFVEHTSYASLATRRTSRRFAQGSQGSSTAQTRSTSMHTYSLRLNPPDHKLENGVVV